MLNTLLHQNSKKAQHHLRFLLILCRNSSLVSLVIIAKNIRQKPSAILKVSVSSPSTTDIAVPKTDSSVRITAA